MHGWFECAPIHGSIHRDRFDPRPSVGSVLSGCLTTSQRDIENAYQDADERYHESYDAAQSVYLDQFTVAEGTATMEVEALYRIDGDLKITLEAPVGSQAHTFSASHGGFGRQSGTMERAIIHEPAAGSWSMEVVAKGEGTYTIGIWLHPGDP